MELGGNLFDSFFKRPQASPKRAKFLSRLFGIFSEELVNIWAEDERSPYLNLGRPTIYGAEGEKNHTLDFTFEDRITGKRFVVEMKCEIEYQGFKYLTLTRPEQLDHHKKSAFTALLRAAKRPNDRSVCVKGDERVVAGAILIWGAVSAEGRKSVIKKFGFHDVIGIERIVSDLAKWKPKALTALTGNYSDWSNELFEFLLNRKKGLVALEIFEKNDKGFIEWRDANPNGFIANAPNSNLQDARKFNWTLIKLHDANCSALRANKNGEQRWTSNGYFKICSNDIDKVDEWFEVNASSPPNWKVPRCQKCCPMA